MADKNTKGSLRQKIDALDNELLKLLEERAEIAKLIGEEKRQKAADPASIPFYDPDRERRVLERLENQAGAHFPKGAVRAVFREIISACRFIQIPLKVAFLGPPGTYSHMAARNTFGLTVDYLDMPTIDQVFESVGRGECAYGIVPIENSTEGGVTTTLDQLLRSNLMIHREVMQPVAHCLARRSAAAERVRRIYSHPQAFAQCDQWLKKHYPDVQRITVRSTADAALSAKEDRLGAAISSELAAEFTGLEVQKSHIQDQAGNSTRFAVIHTTDAPATGHDKTSLVFSTRDGAGSLLQALKVFDKHSINLTRIESRASRDQMWHYVFFADLEGHRSTPSVHQSVEELKTQCPMVRILGSYPNASKPQAG